MLQAVMANPANRGNAMNSVTNSAPDYRRAALVLGAVIVAHLTLLALTLAARNSMVERRVEPRTITAVLLSPEPEPVTPAAAPAVPTTPAVPAAAPPPVARPAAHPAARVKPAPQPRPHAVPPLTPAPSSVATLAPSAPAESAAAITPAPAPARPAEAATEAPATPSPAMPATSAPKNVSHIDCTIPKPDYPDVSRRRGENGTAIVRFVVGLTGRIETAQLQSSSGSARLDEAALAAVHAGACRPYLENGTPLRAAYSQSFVFGLSE